MKKQKTGSTESENLFYKVAVMAKKSIYKAEVGKNQKPQGQLKLLMEKAKNGTPEDVDFIMGCLSMESTIAMTKYIDFSLGLVNNEQGIKRIEKYLFEGSQIQRNYACLFFNRIGEWSIVKRAFEKGLIDEIQAFAR